MKRVANLDELNVGGVPVTGGGSALTVQDEGSNLSTAVTKINFAGAGVTATQPVANEILVTIPGGGGSTIKHAIVSQNSGQSLPASSLTTIDFNVTEYDPDVLYIGSGIFKVPASTVGTVTGRIGFEGIFNFNLTQNIFAQIRILKNNVNYKNSRQLEVGTSTFEPAVGGHFAWSGVANDEFKIQAYLHNHSNSFSTDPTVTNAYFTIEK